MTLHLHNDSVVRYGEVATLNGWCVSRLSLLLDKVMTIGIVEVCLGEPAFYMRLSPSLGAQRPGRHAT